MEPQTVPGPGYVALAVQHPGAKQVEVRPPVRVERNEFSVKLNASRKHGG